MKSTGEVMGIDQNFHWIFEISIHGGNNLPLSGSVFISVRDEDKENILLLSQLLKNLNYNIVATKGTANF